MSPVKGAEPTAGAGRFRPYPSYKDSGVEWLGEIPSHWRVRRLKHLAALNSESLGEDTDPSREIVYLDIGGVNSLGRIVEREELTFATAPSRARRIVRDGDVIVSTVRTYLRAVAPITDPEPGMVVSTGFAVVRPSCDLTTKFAAYALRAPYFVERVVANSKGVSFPAINESEMATYELAAPPEPEQRAIAAFLDRETARIDALVTKKERLIELLQEKRTALITRAVTKGLDPTVPMKESGVEWLGEIPAHWEVGRLKILLTLSREKNGSEPVGEMLSVSGYRGVEPKEYDYEERKRPIEDLADYRVVRVGQLVVNTMWLNYAGLGVSAFEGHVSPAYRSYGIAHRYERGYLHHLMRSAAYVGRYCGLLYGIRPNSLQIKNHDWDSLELLVPPRAEQHAIATYLDRETSRIDALVAKVREATERLGELRGAIVSAAVSGRINVAGA